MIWKDLPDSRNAMLLRKALDDSHTYGIIIMTGLPLVEPKELKVTRPGHSGTRFLYRTMRLHKMSSRDLVAAIEFYQFTNHFTDQGQTTQPSTGTPLDSATRGHGRGTAWVVALWVSDTSDGFQ
eukprot:GHVU01184082.1.p1 GENE.GHVU01184082.1~~GHVU01184082.1.p1  ORF type:complete len:124 (+),score=2.59 GHVU01184082.1:145-516(+)